MLAVDRIDRLNRVRPKTYTIDLGAGPAANASKFVRGGAIIGPRERVVAARVYFMTIATGAGATVAANANITTVALTCGGDTVASAVNGGAITITDGQALTLGTTADLDRAEGDVLRASVVTAASGVDLSGVQVVFEVETQPY